MEGTVLLGTVNAAELFCSPRSVPRNTILSVQAVPSSFDLMAFALICIVSCETLDRQVCAFPNHVQSIEFTTGGHQSMCRNISKMIRRNGWHQRYISNVIAKGLNTFVNVIFKFFLFNKFSKNVKILFWLCHYGVLST